MNEVKTIDPRGLEHHERESLIFPSIEELAQDDTLRIIMEFNPVPLVYLLEARHEFDIRYEKEGPTEWVLAVKRIDENKNRRKQLKAMLLKFREEGSDAKINDNAKKLLQAADAKDLSMTEQELTRQGFPQEDIRRHLCDIHLEILRDNLTAKQMMYQLSHHHGRYSFIEFQKQYLELGEYLTRELEGHIFKEDNIIYQIALQRLSAEEWRQVREECDKIGYCCFTPEDQIDRRS